MTRRWLAMLLTLCLHSAMLLACSGDDEGEPIGVAAGGTPAAGGAPAGGSAGAVEAGGAPTGEGPCARSITPCTAESER